MGILQDAYKPDEFVRLKGGDGIGVKKREWDGWQPDRPLSVQIAGNVIDIKQSARPPRRINVEWIDADTYVDLDTGEIKEAQRSETRGDHMSLPELRRTMARMRGLINANFFGDDNERLVTVTYQENMTDTKRLYYDMQKFVDRMKYRLGEIKYVTAVEPQGRGAWHAHMLVKQLTANSTYLTAEMVQEIWPHGWIVDVEPMTSVDNVGAYLSAYLSNAPDDAAGDVASALPESERRVPKRVIKGARLKMYPRGTHLYRTSRNLEKPLQKKLRPLSSQLLDLIAGAELRYSQKIDLYGHTEAESEYYINSIAHQCYVRKHKPGGGEYND